MTSSATNWNGRSGTAACRRRGRRRRGLPHRTRTPDCSRVLSTRPGWSSGSSEVETCTAIPHVEERRAGAEVRGCRAVVAGKGLQAAEHDEAEVDEDERGAAGVPELAAAEAERRDLALGPRAVREQPDDRRRQPVGELAREHHRAGERLAQPDRRTLEVDEQVREPARRAQVVVVVADGVRPHEHRRELRSSVRWREKRHGERLERAKVGGAAAARQRRAHREVRAAEVRRDAAAVAVGSTARRWGRSASCGPP